MNLKAIAYILSARWYIVGPIVAIALVLAATSAGPPTYKVEASFLLLLPGSEPEVSEEDPTVVEPDNPVVDASTVVNRAAELATSVLEGDLSRDELEARGYAGTYDFEIAPRDPFASVSVEATDPDQATATTLLLTDLLVVEMRNQQLRFGASPDAIGSAELLEVSLPQADYSGVWVRRAGIVALGSLIATLVATTVEGIVFWRRRPNLTEEPSTSEPVAATSDETDEDEEDTLGGGKAERADSQRSNETRESRWTRKPRRTELVFARNSRQRADDDADDVVEDAQAEDSGRQPRRH